MNNIIIILNINIITYFLDRYAPCKLELRKLISHRQDCYDMTMKRHEWAEQEVWKPRLPPPGWRLRSQLVAHLHEHKSGVNRLNYNLLY